MSEWLLFQIMVRRRTKSITWTNAHLLLIWPVRANFSEILKLHLKLSSETFRPSFANLAIGITRYFWNAFNWNQIFVYWFKFRSITCLRVLSAVNRFWIRLGCGAIQSGDDKWHYNDVIMGTMAFQITSLTIVYSTVYSGADQRKHQSSASLAFVCVWGGGGSPGDRWIPRTNGQ